MSNFKNRTNNSSNSIRYPSQRNQYPNENNFRSKRDPPKPKFVIKESEFPQLNSERPIEKTEISASEMDFRGVATQEKEVIKSSKDVVSPGWIRLSYQDGVSGEIVIERGIETIVFEESFSDKANRMFDILIENWENYKKNYNDLYGEDSYENFYCLNLSDEEANANDFDYSSDDEYYI